jgi:NADH-quinone oxidoreductase subunit E
MCILAPKLVSVSRHPNIEIITNAEIQGLSGEPGNFLVTIRKEPRYVDEEKCTGCGLCMQNCPVRQFASVDEGNGRIELSAGDREKIEAILRDHRARPGNLMPLLQTINATYNYLPADLLKYVAKELKVPLSQIYSIATFYNSFSLVPRGRHTIAVCRGTACHLRGSLRILERLEQELGITDGGTTDDLRFSIQTVRCIGCCSIAPAVRVDRDTYGHVRVNEVVNILRKYV